MRMAEGLRLMSRYARQMQLSDVGPDGQRRLAQARVAVIGAGGLGCPVIQYLAGAGIGHLLILDPDIVSESNLHRQPLYRATDVGRPKADAALDFVNLLNPDVVVRARTNALTPANVMQIARNADVIVDAADSFAVSYILSDACREEAKPLISASALGQSGYVGGFCGPAPSLRAVFPELPETSATCATAGVLGAVVGMIGALQAQMALRVLLECDPSPLGQMVTLDLVNLQFGGFGFQGSSEPDTYVPFLARNMLRDRDLIIELRDTIEADQPIHPTASRMTHDQACDIRPEPGQRVVLCCSSGLRAWRAASVLRAAGQYDLALLAARAAE